MGQEVKVSEPPLFDFEQAILAKEHTEKNGLNTYPAVRTACNLWLYNTPFEKWPQILGKLNRLQSKESKAADSNNPLPTIGWEVESPRRPFTPPLSGRYAIFFDLMGLPRNRNHSNVVAGNTTSYSNYWEFSTAPAYSSAVAERTLCELIRGGFIPHLEGPASAQDRYDLLDTKLVSMHISIGIPGWIGIDTPNWTAERDTDILLFASSFELAFTSPERFSNRQQHSIIVGLKDAEFTKKYSSAPAKKLELKAFEVSDRRTYRLMEEIQLVAAAAFCAIAKKETLPEGIWTETKSKIDEIYKRCGVEPSVVAEKEAVVDLLGRCNIQGELRRILTESAHQVRLALSGY